MVARQAMVQIAISPRGPPPDRVVPSPVATPLDSSSTCLCPPPPTPRPARFPLHIPTPHSCAQEPPAPFRYRRRRRLGASVPARVRGQPPAYPSTDATRGCLFVPSPGSLPLRAPCLCPGLLGLVRFLRGALNAPRIARGGGVLRCSWVLACRVSWDRCGSMSFGARIDSVLPAWLRGSS